MFENFSIENSLNIWKNEQIYFKNFRRILKENVKLQRWNKYVHY
jgi:hypothetical protein